MYLLKHSKSYHSDGFIALKHSKSYHSDGFIALKHPKSYLFDGFIVLKYSKSYLFDGFIALKHPKSYLLDGFISLKHSKSYLFDGFIVLKHPKSYLFDGFIALKHSKSYHLDGFIVLKHPLYVFHIVTDGLHDALYNSKVDISYFILCVPFFIWFDKLFKIPASSCYIQIFRYILVGFTAFSMDTLLLYLLTDYFHIVQEQKASIEQNGLSFLTDMENMQKTKAMTTVMYMLEYN